MGRKLKSEKLTGRCLGMSLVGVIGSYLGK